MDQSHGQYEISTTKFTYIRLIYTATESRIKNVLY